MKKSTIVAIIGYTIAAGLIAHGVFALGSSFGKFDVSDEYQTKKGDAESACKKFLLDETKKLQNDYYSDGVLDNAHYQDGFDDLDAEYTVAKQEYDIAEKNRKDYLELDETEALASEEHRDEYQALLDAIDSAQTEYDNAEAARAQYLVDNSLTEEQALASDTHKEAYKALKDAVIEKEKALDDAKKDAKKYLTNNSLTESQALSSDEHKEAYQALKDIADAAKARYNLAKKAVDTYLTITAEVALGDPALKDQYQALSDAFDVATKEFNAKLKEARISFWAYGIPSLLVSLVGFGVATALWTEAQKKDF